VTKLVNNLIGMTTNVVIAEAFSMGVKAGVDAQTLFDVVSASTGYSATLAQWKDSVLKRNFTPGFMLALGHKDARLALELAEQLDIPMPVTSAGKERLAAALAEGWGAEVASVVARLQERDAGVVIEGRSD
jgi:3-hydroxyisobutyrate dehydrogenase-like beta-hydroxyacid dehydrogenase